MAGIKELFASAARTADVVTGSLLKPPRSYYVVLDVTALADTPSIKPRLELHDQVGGVYATLWEAAAGVTAEGTYVYLIHDGTGPSTPPGDVVESVHVPMPDCCRWAVIHADADSITYSLAICAVAPADGWEELTRFRL